MGPPGPLRSDGCPDMRYSSNRSWASSSGSSVPLTTGVVYSSGGSSMASSAASSSARHSSLQLRAVAENAPARLRTDGLPDMRYSANKSFVAEKNLQVPLTTTSKRNSLSSDKSTASSGMLFSIFYYLQCQLQYFIVRFGQNVWTIFFQLQ